MSVRGDANIAIDQRLSINCVLSIRVPLRGVDTESPCRTGVSDVQQPVIPRIFFANMVGRNTPIPTATVAMRPVIRCRVKVSPGNSRFSKLKTSSQACIRKIY